MDTEEYLDELEAYDGYEDYDDPDEYDEYDDEWFDDDDDDEAFDELDDDLVDMLDALGLDDDDDDAAEFLLPYMATRLLTKKRRRRRRRGKSVKRARGRGFYRRPTSRRYVTHAQLRSSLGRVQRDVRRNAAGIKQVNRRVASNRGRLNQQNVINRRQGGQIRDLGRRLDQQSQTSLLMSLLDDDTAGYEVKRVTLASGAPDEAKENANLLVGTKVELEKESDSFSRLLPFLLNASSSTGRGGGGLFGDPTTAMALVLAMK